MNFDRALATGDPVPNALVTIIDLEHVEQVYQSATGETGKAAFEGIWEGPCRILVEAQGFKRYQEAREIREGGGRVEFHLEPLLEVGVKVVDPQGMAVPGLRVAILRDDRGDLKESSTLTDAEGFARFKDLTEGRVVLCVAREGEAWTLKVIDPEKEGSTVLELRPGIPVRGAIRHADPGRREKLVFKNVEIGVVGGGAEADEHGAFSASLSPGNYEIFVMREKSFFPAGNVSCRDSTKPVQLDVDLSRALRNRPKSIRDLQKLR